MKALLLMLLAAAAPCGAKARSLHIQAVAGILSEYQMSADVSDAAAEASGSYSGALTVKHVGLCTHAGPDDVAGQVELRIAKPSDNVSAVFRYGERECRFSGPFSETAVGALICDHKLSLPIRLWATGQTSDNAEGRLP